MHVADLQLAQRAPRAPHQARNALDGVDLLHQRREHGRLVAAAGADLQHLGAPVPPPAAPRSCAQRRRAARSSDRTRSAAPCPRRRGWRAPRPRTDAAAHCESGRARAGSAMPCSCSRCTSRSRVRAEVMPIPLRRGPSMKLLKLDSHRCSSGSAAWRVKSICSGVMEAKPCAIAWKSVPGPGVLTVAGSAHPVHIAAPRILGRHDGLAAMAVAEARDLDAARAPRRADPAR